MLHAVQTQSKQACPDQECCRQGHCFAWGVVSLERHVFFSSVRTVANTECQLLRWHRQTRQNVTGSTCADSTHWHELMRDSLALNCQLDPWCKLLWLGLGNSRPGCCRDRILLLLEQSPSARLSAHILGPLLGCALLIGSIDQMWGRRGSSTVRSRGLLLEISTKMPACTSGGTAGQGLHGRGAAQAHRSSTSLCFVPEPLRHRPGGRQLWALPVGSQGPALRIGVILWVASREQLGSSRSLLHPLPGLDAGIGASLSSPGEEAGDRRDTVLG